MIIAGFDPGIATTGYAIIKRGTDRKLTALDWGVIETKKQQASPERLAIISADLHNLLNKWKPAAAVVEKIYFKNNLKTAIDVAQARGVILLSLQQRHIKILELTPLELKSRIAGYGSADKKQVQRMVKASLGLSAIPKPDDAADALALAICGS